MKKKHNGVKKGVYEMTAPRPIPTKIEWARCDSIAAAREGRRLLREVLESNLEPLSVNKRVILAMERFITIEMAMLEIKTENRHDGQS